MVGTGRVGQGIHDLLVSGKTSGVFQRAPAGAVDQSGRRTVSVRVPAGNQLEPVQPAVAKVLFIKGCARTQGEQLIKGAVLLWPVARFLTHLPRKPLQDLRNLAIDRPQRGKGIICCEPVQVRVLPAKGCLQYLV